MQRWGQIKLSDLEIKKATRHRRAKIAACPMKVSLPATCCFRQGRRCHGRLSPLFFNVAADIHQRHSDRCERLLFSLALAQRSGDCKGLFEFQISHWHQSRHFVLPITTPLRDLICASTASERWAPAGQVGFSFFTPLKRGQYPFYKLPFRFRQTLGLDNSFSSRKATFFYDL